jgi:hypothetical protein
MRAGPPRTHAHIIQVPVLPLEGAVCAFVRTSAPHGGLPQIQQTPLPDLEEDWSSNHLGLRRSQAASLGR